MGKYFYYYRLGLERNTTIKGIIYPKNLKYGSGIVPRYYTEEDKGRFWRALGSGIKIFPIYFRTPDGG
jgi:hypothetical protein